MAGTVLLAIVLFTIVAFIVGQWNGRKLKAEFGARNVHSLPAQHGAYVAVWVGIPALIVVLIWTLLQGTVIDRLLIASLPASLTDGANLDVVVTTVKNVAAGLNIGASDPEIIAAADRYNRWNSIAGWSMAVVAVSLMLIALFVTRTRLKAAFRARTEVERVLSWIMIFCSVVAILTTAGIIASLVFEAFEFFKVVPPHEFLFGLRWEPQEAAGHFGAVPVFAGTVLIAAIAMAVSIPIGIYTAIYLVEYSPPRTRSIIKPILEVLAGVPTIVYGVFAALTVAPAIQDFGTALGIFARPNSALAAGAVMGVMIIPFVSSLTDDALKAVPRAMRDGSLAMGATRGETIRKVMLPAALPGIMGGVLLALSRAIGETMIVVMAAGIIATLTLNPFQDVTTVTVQIVTMLIGDASFEDPRTLSAFALGLVLFVVTLTLNVIALRIVRKYREKYE